MGEHLSDLELPLGVVMDVLGVDCDVSKDDGACMWDFLLSIPLGFQNKLDCRIGAGDPFRFESRQIAGIFCSAL